VNTTAANTSYRGSDKLIVGIVLAVGARKPMLYGCVITAVGILLTCCTFLLAGQYLIACFIGFTLFGIGLGFYATPSTDAALSNVPQDKSGSASVMGLLFNVGLAVIAAIAVIVTVPKDDSRTAKI